MTHFNNWGEIPEELQKSIKEQWRSFINGKIQATHPRVELPSKIWDYIDDAKIFHWAITQGLINKPEPVECYLIPKKACNRSARGNDLAFNYPAAKTIFDNGDGTYIEVKTDVEAKPFDLTAYCKEHTIGLLNQIPKPNGGER